MRDVRFGWLLRYMHANGASMIFFLIYAHMARGLYYQSYKEPRTHVWMSGSLIFILMAGTAFLWYVLPWGQMSFWVATVITNILTAIPVIGQPLVIWIWGGFSINNATLTRFYGLHFLLPLIIAALAILHLLILHRSGSSNPMGVDSSLDNIRFFPYFFLKDRSWLFKDLWPFSYILHFTNPMLLVIPIIILKRTRWLRRHISFHSDTFYPFTLFWNQFQVKSALPLQWACRWAACSCCHF